MKKIYDYGKNLFDFRKATLSGCIDIIAVEQEDGSFKSTPFHVRFGKFKAMKYKDKTVSIYINGEKTLYKLKLGESGVCHFEEYRDRNKRKLSEMSDDNLSDTGMEFASGGEEDESITQEKKNVQLQEMVKEGKISSEVAEDMKTNEKIQWGWGSLPKEKKQHDEKKNQEKFMSPERIDNNKKDKKTQEQEKEEKKGIYYSVKNWFKPKPKEDSKNQKGVAKDDLQLERNKSLETPQSQNLVKSVLKKTSSQPPSEDNVTKEMMENFKMELQITPTKTDGLTQLNTEQVSKEQKHISFSSQNSPINKQKIESPTKIDAVERNEKQDQDDDDSSQISNDDLIELSLCGKMITSKNVGQALEIFESKKVSKDEYMKDPLKILQDKSLMVRIKDELYEWEFASAIIVSQLAFRQELNEKFKTDMITRKKERGFFNQLFGGGKKGSEDIGKSDQQNKNSDKKGNQQVRMKEIRDIIDDKKDEFKDEMVQNNKIKVSSPQSEKQQMQQIDDMSYQSDSSTKGSNKYIKKTLTPSSNILRDFKLKPGANKIKFSLIDGQNEESLEAYIFLYHRNCSLVISDVDGTITRSDIMGQLAPMSGIDWTHDSVVDLFNSISKNGYKFIYLTARAIGQSEQTRQFLNNVMQANQKLPEGPVIMSPDGLFPSFHREVIIKKPELFKIQALKNIKNLFKIQTPLYAGFGNRHNDAIAYKAVNIPINKVFIINPQGECFQYNNITFKKTYRELNQMVEEIFPPITSNNDVISEEFNNSNFWKTDSSELNYELSELICDI